MTKEEKRAGIKHECEIEPEENEFALAQMVSVGWCISFKRFFWSIIMIWRSNSRTLTTYKSSHVVRAENVRKLKMQNYVIHPFSVLRTFWELWMCIIFCIIYFVPINMVAYLAGPISVRYIIRYFLVSSNFLDVLLTFLSGFQYANTGLIICEYYTIAKNYIGTMFFVDVLAISCYALHTFGEYYDHYILKYSQFMIILRLPIFISYASNIRASYDAYTCKSSLITLLLPTVTLFWWFYKMEFTSAEEGIITLYGVLKGFSSITNMGYYFANDADALTLYCLTTVAGFCMELVFWAFLLRVIQKYTHLIYKYSDRLLQMERYAINNNLPKSITKRMFTYMQYQYTNNKFQEKMLFDTLPISLQQELSISLYSQLIEKSATFNRMPMEIILKLTARVTRANYMPTEVIIAHGSDANSMFFIYRGTVAIFMASGKEICHLNHGNSFGELFLFDEEKRNVTVVAVDWCEMAVLAKDDMLNVFKGSPELYAKLQQDVHKRMASQAQEAEEFATGSTGSGTESINTSYVQV